MDEINKASRIEGWEVAVIIDGPKSYLSVLGTHMSTPQARALVMSRAKARSALHLQTLQLCAHSSMPVPLRKTK